MARMPLRRDAMARMPLRRDAMARMPLRRDAMARMPRFAATRWRAAIATRGARLLLDQLVDELLGIGFFALDHHDE
jgi:hypothetical protein